MHWFCQFIVFCDNVISFLYAVIQFLDEFIPLGNKVCDCFVLFVDAVVGVLQSGLQRLNAIFISGNLMGKVFVEKLEPADLAILNHHKLFVGGSGFLEFGDARVHLGHLVIQDRNGIGVILDGGVFLINHLVQHFNFIALDGLFIPLICAKATERERKGDQ